MTNCKAVVRGLLLEESKKISFLSVEWGYNLVSCWKRATINLLGIFAEGTAKTKEKNQRRKDSEKKDRSDGDGIGQDGDRRKKGKKMKGEFARSFSSIQSSRKDKEKKRRVN